MAMRMLDGTLMRQAAVLSYNRVFILVSLLFVVALPLVFLLKSSHAEEIELIVE
jgi:hypothetical protein